MSRFCWIELATTDLTAAERFYGRVFGWKLKHDDLPGGGVYARAKLEGDAGGEVAGLFALDEEARRQTIPPHWGVYVSVPNAEDAVKKARELGARVTAEAFDVLDAGRMAILQDPTGAPFHVWEAKAHKGATASPRRAGMFAWHELSTSDVAKASRFYAGLFGWTTVAEDQGPMKFTAVLDKGEALAGMLEMGSQFKGVPSHWLVHFRVDDCSKAAEAVRAAGGKVLSPATAMRGVGTFAVAQDQQGATFGLLQPAKG